MRAATRMWIAVTGFRDGWNEPDDILTRTNVFESVPPDQVDEALETQDRWVSLGQLVRLGRRSQTWREGFWPVSLLRRD